MKKAIAVSTALIIAAQVTCTYLLVHSRKSNDRPVLVEEVQHTAFDGELIKTELATTRLVGPEGRPTKLQTEGGLQVAFTINAARKFHGELTQLLRVADAQRTASVTP